MTEQYKDYKDMKKLFDISKFSELKENETIDEKFEEIAKELFNNYHIVKGDITYEFLEIEFYLYTPNHQDIITYPRNAKAGDWFFHTSGVDICFGPCKVKGNINYTKEKNEKGKNVDLIKQNSCFGGILIRSLLKKDSNGNYYVINGPQRCCNDLFDQFSAIKMIDKQYPYLVNYSKDPKETKKAEEPIPRHLNFEKPEMKFNDLNKKFHTKIDKEDFNTYIKSEYRFYRFYSQDLNIVQKERPSNYFENIKSYKNKILE